MAESPADLRPTKRYTVRREGTAYGPYGLAEIKAYAVDGRLRLTDQAWLEGALHPTTVGALLSSEGPQRDVTDGVIPYKNPAALASYYVGLASVIPVLGIFTGIAAVVLGIKGLRRFHAEPWRRGRIHSYAGIFLGTVTSLTWCVLLAFFIVPWLRALQSLHH